ncbi:hypothetical protein FQA39_LY01468 [Lamprigera yunnana]|nr:hypothetical protein FQA39_LY01468 [Lamprigera yunnana]
MNISNISASIDPGTKTKVERKPGFRVKSAMHYLKHKDELLHSFNDEKEADIDICVNHLDIFAFKNEPPSKTETVTRCIPVNPIQNSKIIFQNIKKEK